MKPMTFIGAALCVSAMTLALSGIAHAQANRTFVSGTGSDTNTSSLCAVTTPCRTLLAALSVTNAGGEIDAENAAGYGSISISNINLTLHGVPGASITAPSSGNGVTISAAGKTVTIDSWEITGVGVPATNGVVLTAGNLVLRNSVVEYLAVGLLVGNNSSTAHADVVNTDFIGNNIGLETDGAGVDTANGNAPYTGTQTLVRINGGNAMDNTTAFDMINAGSDKNGNCENTFWMFTSASSGTMNVTGSTTLLVNTPSSPPYSCEVGFTYNTTGAPN